MIYEVRTYQVNTGSLAEVEKRFGEAYEHRKKYSPLAGFFHTELGPLNEIIHVWPYESHAEREKVRAAAAKDANWPPKIQEFIRTMQSEIFIKAPFCPEVKPGKLGPYFEVREYTFKAGSLPAILERWGEKLPGRLKFSPIAFCGSSDFGTANKWIHVWPYESLDQRNSVRAQARDAGAWPPGAPPGTFLTQHSKIVMPSAFSPLQ
ncbi:MAG: NIPSNAP family protein [Candidatus Rokuibacteriota bacterium]